MQNLNAYEGQKPYIFVSYAHKDAERVLPVIDALQKKGFRIWFDQGIEAGTEWPEYIEEHLIGCARVLAFMSEAAVGSINCRNEINLALSLKKEMLVVYLEETTLRHGMLLQLSSVQSMYAHRLGNVADICEELFRAKLLAPCVGEMPTTPSPQPMPETVEVAEEGTSEGLAYAPLAGGKVSLCGIGECSDIELFVPKTHEGMPVASIAPAAFKNNGGIYSVRLPEGVTEIGKEAFSWCRSLARVSLPSSLMVLGGNAFTSCALCEVELPEKITRVPSLCFWGCKNLKTVRFTENVTELDAFAFACCKSLGELTLPDRVNKIGINCFTECNSLTHIVIPAAVHSIGGGCFKKCPRLARITYGGSVENAKMLFKHPRWRLKIRRGCVIECADGKYTV